MFRSVISVVFAQFDQSHTTRSDAYCGKIEQSKPTQNRPDSCDQCNTMRQYIRYVLERDLKSQEFLDLLKKQQLPA